MIIKWLITIVYMEVKLMAKARCMKCKKQVEMEKSKRVRMKNGRFRMAGVCGKCGTKVSRILGKDK